MARKAPKIDVLRNLSVLSKNQCAFPKCDHPILNEKGEYVAQLCHIEAAEKGGPRFNSEQTDEERRSESNLLFLCHRHHKETDDEKVYTVKRLKEMKQSHEKLPSVEFNNELLLKQIQNVLEEQEKITKIINKSQSVSITQNYNIIGPDIRTAWTPEDGRFYESTISDHGTKFKYMMKEGWLYIEQTLSDGAIAYYEVNESGSVRNSKMPYPINEYRVEISDTLILSKGRVDSTVGDYAIKTILKWSLGDVVEHYRHDGLFLGANCNARCTIDHNKREISVLGGSKP